MSSRSPLLRSHTNRAVAGVCAGLAEHLEVPVLWVRLGMVLTSFIGGAGVVLYIFLLCTMPEEGASSPTLPLRRVLTRPNTGHNAPTTTPPEQSSKRSPRRNNLPVAEILFGASLLAAGVSLLLVQLGVQLDLKVILPGLAVFVGVGLTCWLIVDRHRLGRHLLPRILGAFALVTVGIVMFFITARERTVFSVFVTALAVFAAVALAIAPWLLQINRELVAVRAARAREAERTEIAAHLHDSVLQTLALIQQRSEPGTEVARLARRQERDLRAWLFRSADGATPDARDTAAAELTEHAAALESQHPVRFEVIVVGERIVATEPIVAAAREAMQNAAQHARGEVTVYLETTPKLISIEINDRGPGFNPDNIQGPRFGIRESIRGRMQRAGGTAQLRPGPGGRGVSVQLEHPRVDIETPIDQDEVS